jgi:hypothetical protein
MIIVLGLTSSKKLEKVKRTANRVNLTVVVILMKLKTFLIIR